MPLPPSKTPVTWGLIAANTVVFLLQQVIGNSLLAVFALWAPSDQLFHPWQLLTYSLLHYDLTHIFFNMFALFMFGRPLELFWGRGRFIFYYAVCVLSASVIEMIDMNASHDVGPVIGASGGIFGLLLGFGWYFPRQRILLLFPPIPMPAWLFVTLYGAAELFFGVAGIQAGVAHFAHLGGMLGGALAILYWRMRGEFGGNYRGN
jgi:membrane associated rhomboid family serine protease